MNRETNSRRARGKKKVKGDFKQQTPKFLPLVKRSYSGSDVNHPHEDPYGQIKSKFVKELGKIHRQQRTTERDSVTNRYSAEVRKLIKADPASYLTSPAPSNDPLHPVAVNATAQNEPLSYYRNENQMANLQNQPTAYQNPMSDYGMSIPIEIQQQHASSIYGSMQSMPQNNATYLQSHAFSQSNFNHIQPMYGYPGSVGVNYGSYVVNNVNPMNIYCMNPGYASTTPFSTQAAPLPIAHAPPPMTVYSPPADALGPIAPPSPMAVYSPPSTTKTTMDVQDSDPSTNPAAVEPMPVLEATAQVLQ